MKRIAFFIVLIATSAFAYSQKDTVDLEPVEVKSVRAGATAPFTKTNIDKATIEKQNLGQDLPFLLNQTPSVVVNSDAGNGIGYTGIRIRGTDATRINVTLNGVPFNDAESNGTFFVNMPDFSSSVNSIQVQRGVGTSSNGAGAFGATINLSTNEVNKERYVELNNSYGSFNSWKNTIKFGSGLLNERFTIDARLSKISSDGYVDRATSDLKSYFFSTAYLRDKTSLRFVTFSGKEKTYQAWYGISEEDLKYNRTINYAGMEKPGDPYENETDNYKQDHYQLFFNHKFSPAFTFNTGLFYVKGKGYYEQYKADQRYSRYGLTPPNSTLTQTDLIRQLWLDNDYYGNIFSFLFNKNGTSLTVGGAITNYIGDHFGEVIWAKEGLTGNTRWYNADAEKSDRNIYVKWQQKLKEGLLLYTDVQYRNVNYDLNGFRYNPDISLDNNYNFLNPKIGISYIKNNWFGYASYGIANKEPNRDDFEAGINEQPKPERLHDLEIGMQRKISNTSVGATFYYMDYQDQLVLTGKINDVGAYTRTNIDDSYRTGIELEMNSHIKPWLQLSGNIAFSRNKIRNFSEYIDDYDNGNQKINFYEEADIAFSPSVVSAVTLALKPIKSFELALIGKYVGKQYLDNTNNENRKLDAYYNQDVRATYTFSKKWFKNVNIIGQVNNVFNTLYAPNGYTFSYYYNNELATENYFYPMATRNWVVGVNVRF